MQLSGITDMHSGVGGSTNIDNLRALLNSIKVLNNNIAKLIDAEIDRISFVVDEGESSRLSAADIITIYQNINRVVRNTMNLQTLLQLKLDDILAAALGIIPISTVNSGIKTNKNSLDMVPNTINEKRKHKYVTVI